MIPFFLSLPIAFSAGWLAFQLVQSFQQRTALTRWFASFSADHLESLTFVWNRTLILWLTPFLKKLRFKNSEVAGWSFCLGLESALLFSLFFGFGWGAVCLGGLSGAGYPWIWKGFQRRKRILSIRRELPFVIDLLAISTQAGLDMMQVIQRMAVFLPVSPLTNELKKILEDLKLGRSRREALEAFKERVGLFEVHCFVSLLSQAIGFGTPLSAVLTATSQQMRDNRLQRAERLGLQAGIKILFPLVFCILPAIFLLIFAPLGLRFMQGGWEGMLW